MSIVEQTLARMRARAGTNPPEPTPLRSTVPVARLQPQDASPPAPVQREVAAPVVEQQPVAPRRRVVVDREAMRAAGLVAPLSNERRTAEEYRHIKRPLLSAAADPAQRVMMVGSAFPGEGKSFTCVNLAMSLSLEKDWQVLLIDADVIKPQVSKLFGVSYEAGLIDALSTPDLDPETLIVETDIPNLSVLPSGRRDEHATELLGSTRMREIIRRLTTASANRLLVFDSPPMLATSEANVLASYMGQIVLVVAANTTPQSAVTEVVKLLGDGPKVKLVLNKVERSKAGNPYYGYGYGYGYYEAVSRHDNNN
jgi:protein-tyrosine kinase